MVGASDVAGEVTARLRTDSRASVTANVVKRSQDAVQSTHDNDALRADVPYEVVAGVRHLLRPPGAYPPAQKDPVLFLLEDLRRGEEAARKRHRAAIADLRRLQKGRHQCLLTAV